MCIALYRMEINQVRYSPNIPVSHPPIRENIPAAAIVPATITSCQIVDRPNSSLDKEKSVVNFAVIIALQQIRIIQSSPKA